MRFFPHAQIRSFVHLTAAPSTRARSRTRGGRDVVLDAAVDNFQRLGYHGTSMRDIARSADITAASIYHHFASKQLILQDIMLRVLGDALSVTRSALLRSGAAPADQLSAVMRACTSARPSTRATPPAPPAPS